MSADVQLESLVGLHTLDALDFDSEPINTWSDHFKDASIMRFRLDGIAYTAVEDPDDGYRSAMDRLYVSDAPMKNTFPPVRVMCSMKANDRNQHNDTLQFLNAATGAVIAEVGTDNTGDYYPWFVAYFNPEAL